MASRSEDVGHVREGRRNGEKATAESARRLICSVHRTIIIIIIPKNVTGTYGEGSDGHFEGSRAHRDRERDGDALEALQLKAVAASLLYHSGQNTCMSYQSHSKQSSPENNICR